MDGLTGTILGWLLALALLVVVGALLLRLACWLLYVEVPSFSRLLAIVALQVLASLAIGFAMGFAMGVTVGQAGVSQAMMHAMNVLLNMFIAASLYARLLNVSYLKALALFWAWAVAMAISAALILVVSLGLLRMFSGG